MNRSQDPRNIANGFPIPKEHYCDQPYVVVRPDGAWVCMLTTGMGREGDSGQHVISCISTDCGRTWSAPIDIEPPEPPESSWVMPYLTEYGRIYSFYTYNGDNMRTVKMENEKGYTERVDTLGYFAYKYSDDGGLSWSERRRYIPVRNFAIDERNPYGGKVQYFWGVGKPIRHQGAMYMGFAKVGLFGEGFMENDEGAFIRCTNIDTERDPDKLVWETLPEGDVGLCAPEGKVADEHNLVSLSDGSLYCTFRTVAGHNAHAYSRDCGKTWTAPEFASYTPGGRLMKHPRAANFVHKYANGKYTLWFHNRGKNMLGDPGRAYYGRNPAWLLGGVERGGFIYWSQPEIVLYGQYGEGISYPDFIESNGEYYITETQKTIARTHQVDKHLLDALWNQHENRELARDGMTFEAKPCPTDFVPIACSMNFSKDDSFSLQLVLDTENLLPGLLLDGRNALRQGITLEYTADKMLRVALNDGEKECCWASDPLEDGTHHVTLIADGCARILSFVVDGVFCDGGAWRDYGFGRIDGDLNDVSGAGVLHISPACANRIPLLRMYSRHLLTSEAVGNYHHDMQPDTAQQ